MTAWFNGKFFNKRLGILAVVATTVLLGIAVLLSGFLQSVVLQRPEIVLVLGLSCVAVIAVATYLLLLTKAYSKQLAAAQQNLAYAQQIAHLGSWFWNLRTDTVHFSSEALKMLNLPPTQHVISFEAFLNFIPVDQQKAFKAATKVVRSGGQALSEVFTFVCPDQVKRQIYIDTKITKRKNGFPIEIVGILQDVTAQKHLEEQLQQAQKMEIIGQLTGGLAHEFNNLLMIIQGNLELLSARFVENTVESRRLRAAMSATEKGAELTNRLLAFSHCQPLRPVSLDPREVISGLVKLLKPSLGEAIEIIVMMPPEIWPVWVDAGQLENALLNLVLNARDAMSGKGKLIFDLTNVKLDEKIAIEEYQIQPGEYVKISVTDTGVGITPEMLPHVFEPFFTTKNVGQGSGLGLSMVYGFVKQSQGHVTISSKVSRGTTVCLYLPRATEVSEDLPQQQKLAYVDMVSSGGEKILIVEDESQLRKLTVEYLKGLGYQVYEANDGNEALKILRKIPAISLLFTDVIMPNNLSGPELAQKAKQINPQIKVLFSSGYPKVALFDQATFTISATSTQLLSKPYKMHDLGKKIREVLDEE